MDAESVMLGGMILAPAAIALLALVLSVVFFKKAGESKSPTLLRLVGVLFLVVSLGIGSCYAAMFLG